MHLENPERLKRWWYWPPWQLTNPLWPWFWRGGDGYGRPTVVFQPPLLGAFIVAVGPPCEGCAVGDDRLHRSTCKWFGCWPPKPEVLRDV